MTKDSDIRKNGSGYFDPTAYKALKNFEKPKKESVKRMSEEQKKKEDEWCKTCVFYGDCDDMDQFIKSDQEECDWYA